jgi:hypothetical protein
MGREPRSQRLIVAAFALAVMSTRPSLQAATPPSGTVSPASTTSGFSGGPFDFTNQTGVPNVPPAPPVSPVCLNPYSPCDDFALTVAIPPTDSTIYVLKVDLHFANLASDFDLYLIDADGVTVDAISADTTGVQESFTMQVPSGATTNYTVRVVPFDVVTGAGGDTYTTNVTLAHAQPPIDPPELPTVAGVPRFEIYQSPIGMGDDAGEPSIGADWATAKAMFQAGLRTLRVGWNDCSSPADATWEDVSFTTTSSASLDPILFTDSGTNRTFSSQLTGACSASAFSDDDGASWTPSQGCGTPAGADHQTFGGGPFAPGPTDCHTPLYPNAVYYCSQSNATSFCAMSCDGGLTFGPGVPAWTLVDCSAIHGHVKVAPDGTVYVPNKNCTGTGGVIVSSDNGATWTVRKVTGSTASKNGWLLDPSVGIGAGGKVYFGYQRNDGHPWIAVSDDKGVSWHDNQEVGTEFGIKNSTFPEVVAGDNLRAAYAFLGTLSEGDYGDPPSFAGLWHLFIATTFDGGVTWTTVDATPNDPVQRGSICNQGTTACDHVPDDRNLLDFNDITMDKFGRVLVGFSDGCISNSCISGQTYNDYTAKATIARQSGGKRLLAQYDPSPVEPIAPKAPKLSAARTAPGIVHLAWTKPDNGGALVTSYKIYRGVTSGGEVLLTTTPAKNTHDDISADAGTAYYYRITAVNSAGEGAFCNEVFVPTTVSLGTDPCTVPGVTVSTDTSDSAPNLPAQPAVDLKSVSVAEPYAGGASQLVVTIQVGEAAAAPATAQWYVMWNRPVPSGSADRNYVAAKTSATGVVSYEYGTISPPNQNLPTRLGAADDGSYDPTTGIIRIVIANSHVDGVAAGQTLTTLTARTFTRPDGLPVTQSASQDFSPAGQYNLVGNESCRTNAAPIATLSRSPDEGCVPLTVTFDGSPSTDSDAGDTIASYQFSFTDGTPDIVQSTPTLEHVFTSSGDFSARLRVTDSRGKGSLNVDQKTTAVEPCPIAELGSLTWAAGSKDTLAWPSDPNATGYRVYRGLAADLPKLLNATLDSCVRFEGAAGSTGPVLTEIPAAGSFYWYLTIGVRGPVVGAAGDASAGQRIVNPSGTCP